jgi:transposase-like protein
MNRYCTTPKKCFDESKQKKQSPNKSSRKQDNVEERIELVKEALLVGNTAAIARKYQIRTKSLYQWVKLYRNDIEEFTDKTLTK